MYAFAHIEGTGGRTVVSILRRSFGAGHCDIRIPWSRRSGDQPKSQPDRRVLVDEQILSLVRFLYRNLKGIAGHSVKPYGEFSLSNPHIRYFTFFRNPAARLRSHFLSEVLTDHGEQSFNSWIAAGWVHNWQTKMIAGEPNAQKAIELLSNRVDFVGLTERFEESVLLLGQWLGDTKFRPEYRPINRSSDKRPPDEVARILHATRYLDSDRARAQIQKAISEDQKVYNFVTSTIFPRQITSYLGNLDSDIRSLQQRNLRGAWPREPLVSRVLRNYIYKPLSFLPCLR